MATRDVNSTSRDVDQTVNNPGDRREPKENRDPITGAPGSHPIGTGVGAAAGGAGAAMAGAAIGAAISGPAAPIGGAIGAVVGAVVGGYAGKGVAEQIDPSVHDAYWRENHRSRPYVESHATYDQDYQPAYRYGWESRSQNPDRKFDEMESTLGSGWDKVKDKSRLSWEKAKEATRDAWRHIDEPGSDRDQSMLSSPASTASMPGQDIRETSRNPDRTSDGRSVQSTMTGQGIADVEKDRPVL